MDKLKMKSNNIWDFRDKTRKALIELKNGTKIVGVIEWVEDGSEIDSEYDYMTVRLSNGLLKIYFQNEIETIEE